MILENFIKLYESSFRENWDLPALTDYNEQRTLTYEDVAREIAKLHILFRHCQIRRGDKIALVGKNTSNWCIAFMATVSYEKGRFCPVRKRSFSVRRKPSQAHCVRQPFPFLASQSSPRPGEVVPLRGSFLPSVGQRERSSPFGGAGAGAPERVCSLPLGKLASRSDD